MALINEILDRIKMKSELKKDSDLAKLLKVEPQNVFNWRKRGTIPWNEMYAYAGENQLSMDWLINGDEQEGGKSLAVNSHEIELILRLLDEQSKRMDDQQKHIDNLAKLITRYKDEIEKMWEIINKRIPG